MAKQLTLDEYVRLAHMEIEKFRLYWTQQRNQNPANWPENMMAGDWDEQLTAWIVSARPVELGKQSLKDLQKIERALEQLLTRRES